MATDDHYQAALERYLEAGYCRSYKKYNGKSCIRVKGLGDEECRCSAGWRYLNCDKRKYGYE